MFSHANEHDRSQKRSQVNQLNHFYKGLTLLLGQFRLNPFQKFGTLYGRDNLLEFPDFLLALGFKLLGAVMHYCQGGAPRSVKIPKG